jgi:hypothetical protein
MKKLFCILILVILFSCKKDTQNNVSTEINVEGVSLDNNTANIELTTGNVSFVIPGDYAISYYDEMENLYVRLNDIDTSKSLIRSYKSINILFFKKDHNYNWGFNATGVPEFEDYLNGISEKKPFFHVATKAASRKKYFKNINVLEVLVLSMWDVGDVSFKNEIIFTDNEYFYRITVSFWGTHFIRNFMHELSNYFIFDEYIHWNINKQNELCDQFTNFQQMPEYIESLLERTNNVFNSIEFINN